MTILSIRVVCDHEAMSAGEFQILAEAKACSAFVVEGVVGGAVGGGTGVGPPGLLTVRGFPSEDFSMEHPTEITAKHTKATIFTYFLLERSARFQLYIIFSRLSSMKIWLC
ncbi:MAG: hypothetical protein WAX44_00135 [Minisyncoccia bacterium]